ncbi:protein of unknown function [Burkholderia multivorans]
MREIIGHCHICRTRHRNQAAILIAKIIEWRNEVYVRLIRKISYENINSVDGGVEPLKCAILYSRYEEPPAEF